jgi:hypothetical protein
MPDNPYHYSPIEGDGALETKLHERSAIRYDVSFPSAQVPPLLGGTTVGAEYFFPRSRNKAPLAIILHGMGDSSLIPCRMIARSLAGRGIASLILLTVLHKSRMPGAIRSKYPRLSAQEWFEAYQISVTDARQALDWAGRRPEIIPGQAAIIGISFGGFIASIAMGLDTRFKAGIFIESGGNSDKITRHSLLLRFQYKLGQEEYRRNQAMYADYLREVAARGYEAADSPKQSYLTDPKTFAAAVKTRPVLMLNAWLDEMIPRAAVLDLWEAYDRPALHWYPATHATIWMWYPWMRSKITRFLEKNFAPPGKQF